MPCSRSRHLWPPSHASCLRLEANEEGQHAPSSARRDRGETCLVQVGRNLRPAIKIHEDEPPARPQHAVDLVQARTPDVRGQVMQHEAGEDDIHALCVNGRHSITPSLKRAGLDRLAGVCWATRIMSGAGSMPTTEPAGPTIWAVASPAPRSRNQRPGLSRKAPAPPPPGFDRGTPGPVPRSGRGSHERERDRRCMGLHASHDCTPTSVARRRSCRAVRRRARRTSRKRRSRRAPAENPTRSEP
jgi:hypothetical protein